MKWISIDGQYRVVLPNHPRKFTRVRAGMSSCPTASPKHSLSSYSDTSDLADKSLRFLRNQYDQLLTSIENTGRSRVPSHQGQSMPELASTSSHRNLATPVNSCGKVEFPAARWNCNKIRPANCPRSDSMLAPSPPSPPVRSRCALSRPSIPSRTKT